MRLAKGLGVILVMSTGCEDVIDLDPVDETPVVEARVRPKPIIGGTLTVTAANIAVAADPDRDLVHVVDVAERTVLHTIELQPGDEPGRVAEGSEGLAHVVLRGTGEVAAIDLQAGTVTDRRFVCPDPRGIAFDDTEGTLHVACADGSLVQLGEASGEELERIVVEPDLRDVVFANGRRYVSTFRSAWLSAPDDGGAFRPVPVDDQVPRVAWRTVADDGRIVMLHQLSTTDPVPLTPAGDPGREDAGDDFGGGGDLPYGGGGGGCEPGISNTALTVIDGDVLDTGFLPNAALAVDVALSPDGDWVALAMPGAESGAASLVRVRFGDSSCVPTPIAGDGQFTAVAFSPDGWLVAQSREPVRLMLAPPAPFEGEPQIIIPLEGESRFDTGHEVFHRVTDSGLSCASCHPEGGDDGHVWRFEGLGKRRTQPLDIGLEGTAPFHWDGDMDDLDVLMEEVLSHRMGGMKQSGARRDSFARWLFEQQRPPADPGRDDPTLVRDGEALFSAYGCTTCHMGEKLGATMAAPVRGMQLQVPSLRRVSLRPPFMHDGRALTLEGATRDMIEATTTADPPDYDVEAITAYMRTL